MIVHAVGNFPSLWDGVETLGTSLKMVKTTQDAAMRTASDLKTEFDSMFLSLSTWKVQVDVSMANLSSQLEPVVSILILRLLLLFSQQMCCALNSVLLSWKGR